MSSFDPEVEFLYSGKASSLPEHPPRFTSRRGPSGAHFRGPVSVPRVRSPGMAFAWTYLDDGGEEAGRSASFDDREAAEEWMGACWGDLLDRGIEEVVLFDLARDRRLYRMGLRAE